MNVIKTFPNKTSTDLTGKEGYLVKYDTSGVNVCSAITDHAVGVIVRAGETECDVCVFGECVAKAGGTVTRGKHIIPHTDGTVKQNTGTAARVVVAEACEAGAASELIEAILITPIEIAAE
jgi:hypothetical protein